MKNTETRRSYFGGPEYGQVRSRGTHHPIPEKPGDLQRGFTSEPLMDPEDQGARRELDLLGGPWPTKLDAYE